MRNWLCCVSLAILAGGLEIASAGGVAPLSFTKPTVTPQRAIRATLRAEAETQKAGGASRAAPSTKSAGSAQGAIRAVLDAQAAAWNRGDVEGFMAGYWKSPETEFAGASGVTKGWQAVHDRYRSNYPDKAAMGRLTFDALEINVLSPDAAYIVGHWQLERQLDHPAGVFTLIARRFSQGWRIVHDHTSVFPAASARK